MRQIFDTALVDSFQKVVEQSILKLANGKDLTAFQETLRDGMNQICVTIQQRLLEQIDGELVANSTARKNWVITRRNDPKTILSPFGPVTYHRTYFKNKKTRRHAYLTDNLVGYTPHQRLDTLLEADVLTESLDRSFRKAGKSQGKRAKGTEVSGQTVLNIVRKLQPEKVEIKEAPRRRRKCPIIYIEADEDHVPHQKKGTRAFEQKLVYIHEGRTALSQGRYQLLNKKYLTFSPGTKTEEIWNTIWHYLDDTYALEKAERIYISGDGAYWIKAGAEYIPNSTYVLDSFHLRQAILRGAGADKDNRRALGKAIWYAKQTQMNKILTQLLKAAGEESRRQTIINVYKYLNNNWHGIKASKEHREYIVGCSAEGHVSHVLSARLSSRPMGWSYLGANQMAHLRVHRENGMDIHKLYIKEHKKENKFSARKRYSMPTAIPTVKAAGGSFETLDNIPSFRDGSNAFARLLRRIANYGDNI